MSVPPLLLLEAQTDILDLADLPLFLTYPIPCFVLSERTHWARAEDILA